MLGVLFDREEVRAQFVIRSGAGDRRGSTGRGFVALYWWLHVLSLYGVKLQNDSVSAKSDCELEGFEFLSM